MTKQRAKVVYYIRTKNDENPTSRIDHLKTVGQYFRYYLLITRYYYHESSIDNAFLYMK